MRNSGLVAALVALVGHPLGAQTGRDFQFHGVGIVTATRFYGGGVGAAVRPAGRMRLAITASAGDLEGEIGGRGTLVVTYHLYPFRRRGVAPYAGGGVSVLAASGTREYLVLLLGIEQGPASPRGWFVEVGLTGGLVLSAGVRLRWRSRQR